MYFHKNTDFIAQLNNYNLPYIIITERKLRLDPCKKSRFLWIFGWI